MTIQDIIDRDELYPTPSIHLLRGRAVRLDVRFLVGRKELVQTEDDRLYL